MDDLPRSKDSHRDLGCPQHSLTRKYGGLAEPEATGRIKWWKNLGDGGRCDAASCWIAGFIYPQQICM